MKLGMVTGRVVSTQQHESLSGLTLLLVQPLDRDRQPAGLPLVAFDVAKAGTGDLVFYENGKEAAQANPNGWFNPLDAVVLGVVDAVNRAEREE